MKRARGQRLMCVGYAEVLGAALHGATWLDVAEQVNISRMTAQLTLGRLVDAEILHEAEWAKRFVNARAVHTPVYRIGPGGPLLTWPGRGERKPRRRAAPPIELLTFIHAIRALQTDAHNGKSLAEATGMGRRTASALIRRLHALRLIYSDDFDQRPNGAWGYPRYAWGHQRDAVKPPPIPRDVLWHRWNRVRAARKRAALLLGLMSAPASNSEQIHQRA